MVTRRFRTLRLSVTSFCNLSCLYCNPEGERLKSGEIRNAHFYASIVKLIHDTNPVRKVRITGGEPAFYPFLAELVGELKMIGIPEVHLTTNGTMLARLAADLKMSGLDGVNVSVDAHEKKIFRSVCGADRIDSVFSGIESAMNAGLNVKINCTVMRTRNAPILRSMLDHFASMGLTIRFLELMRMGTVSREHAREFFSRTSILEALSPDEPPVSEGRQHGSTTEYFHTREGKRFGIIANHSNSFCEDCDRLRIDQNGLMYGCLTSRKPFNPVEQPGDITEMLREALSEKKATFTGNETVKMMRIGG